MSSLIRKIQEPWVYITIYNNLIILLFIFNFDMLVFLIFTIPVFRGLYAVH